MTDDKKTTSSLWNFYHSTGGSPGLIDQGGLDKTLGIHIPFAFHISATNWTEGTKLQHALVRRLGGFVELAEEELQPRPDDSLTVSNDDGIIRARSHTAFPCPPKTAMTRFKNDPLFNKLCHVLHNLVCGGRFSAPDLVDAVTVACAMECGKKGD